MCNVLLHNKFLVQQTNDPIKNIEHESEKIGLAAYPACEHATNSELSTFFSVPSPEDEPRRMNHNSQRCIENEQRGEAKFVHLYSTNKNRLLPARPPALAGDGPTAMNGRKSLASNVMRM